MTAQPINTEEALRRVIHTTPIIDHHAHPLLKLSAIRKHPLLSIATEANGDAIEDSKTSLAHLRVVKLLSGHLGTEPTWDAVDAAITRKQKGSYDEWIKTCLSGIENILVDDLLGDPADVEPYHTLDAYTRSPNKRILRIEEVAAACIEKACGQFSHPSEAFSGSVENFMNAIYDALDDPEIVGFKSVICYRTGLAVTQVTDLEVIMQKFQLIFDARKEDGAQPFERLDHEPLNDYFLHILAGLVQNSEDEHKKPIQFHTGLGDNDITLSKSSPAHLQEFIKTYPDVPIVLLHASYPFTRELGYLATVYGNVYADIGEVFPFISREGQEGVVRQILELCPTSKILWSTDGHFFPETYIVAVDQLREVLQTVLIDYVNKGDLTWTQAAQLTRDILFNNANKLYDLGLEFKPLLTNSSHGLESSEQNNIATLSRFLKNKEEPRFLQVTWTDFTAMTRVRAIPMRRVWSLLRSGEDFAFGVTKAGLGLDQRDCPVPSVTPTGEYKLHPDLSTLRLGPRKGYITVMGDFKEKDGSAASFCTRTLLKRTLDQAAKQGLEFTLGFEIELVLFRRCREGKYEPLETDGHAWSVTRAMDHEAATEVLEDAIEKLDAAGIYIEMMHPESANGQYEFVMPKAPALEAVDNLLFTRDVISGCATAKGFRMTLHPKPYATSCGTAAHMHMSISSPIGSEKEVYEPFYAGILKHLRAIAAFTYSSKVSYDRVVDGCWAGGTWVAWGTQNREVPLRKIDGSHWEIKCIDGIANSYLSLAAIILAGVQGLADNERLALGDCTKDPALLSSSEREELNISVRIPRSIQEALEALHQDEELTGLLGSEVVERYTEVKKAETAILEEMGVDERWQWIMERY
jgi:glutamine synthetase